MAAIMAENTGLVRAGISVDIELNEHPDPIRDEICICFASVVYGIRCEREQYLHP
jgi:hypothetical protein